MLDPAKAAPRAEVAPVVNVPIVMASAMTKVRAMRVLLAGAPNRRAPKLRHVCVSLLLVCAVALAGVAVAREGGTTQVSHHGSEVIASFAPMAIEDIPVRRSRAGMSADDRRRAAYASRIGMTVVTKGRLFAGQSLAGELGKRGVSAAVIHMITTEVRPLFNFRRSRPGHRYRVALDSDGNLVDFRYSTSVTESVYLFWDVDHYVARRDLADLEPRVASLAGIVESSLYEAIRNQGENPSLAGDFAEIFAWDIDFTRNVKSGDEFSILYERLYITDDDGDELYVRPGRILAARYRGRVGDHSAIYFGAPDGRGSYFRPDGSSVERAFLVAPLQYSRISSTYQSARRHPILNVTRRHPGIDYAAREGTPLWAVADGTVVFRGGAGGSGNLVKIRHLNGYVSQYAHLSRFAEGLRVGDRVEQKDVIGYVGHTGLATGSHVCFRVTRNGRYVNPLEIQSPPARPVDLADSTDFVQVRDALFTDLDVRTLVASDEAL